MSSFDGQGSGGAVYGTFWEPPHGWVNSQDGGRGHGFMVIFVRVDQLSSVFMPTRDVQDDC